MAFPAILRSSSASMQRFLNAPEKQPWNFGIGPDDAQAAPSISKPRDLRNGFQFLNLFQDTSQESLLRGDQQVLTWPANVENI